MTLRRVEIPLTLDAEFFTLVKGDVKHLDLIQENTEKALVDKIAELSQQVISLTKPSRYKTTDMNRWRELFDIYLQAGVFFSTKELDHGQRNSTIAKRQLEWFQEEVHRRGLTGSFKLSVSREALNRFLDINVTLWQNLKYQEMNQQAIGKILKKFDKRTLLGARKTFPRFIQRHPIISSSIAKAVCSRITQDLIKITPQLDDFLCPICLSVVWRPIKMKCQHLFCIGCTVAMQRQGKQFCPLCRENVILDADTDSIDEELSKYLKKYFPKEVRQKQIELETAAGREQFGVLYKHPSEQRCNIM
ncbi:SPX domain-containing protein [Bisporella sp. PMI_857]|nr:SPX domain-containing protein [Bisporella sp. PMI_857]